MTATVGGLWDSLLAEGRPWWITADSDSHNVYADTAMRVRARSRGRGAAVDPHGPAMDVPGDADPWRDLWFYSNPMGCRPPDEGSGASALTTGRTHPS
ncbi:hypothetical protein [Streptomyces sp. NPDC094472]